MTLPRNKYGYNYTPDPMLNRWQKVQRFFQRRKQPFWIVVGCIVYLASIAIMQQLDADATQERVEQAYFEGYKTATDEIKSGSNPLFVGQVCSRWWFGNTPEKLAATRKQMCGGRS